MGIGEGIVPSFYDAICGVLDEWGGVWSLALYDIEVVTHDFLSLVFLIVLPLGASQKVYVVAER